VFFIFTLLFRGQFIFNDVYFLENQNGIEKIEFSVVNKEYKKFSKHILDFLNKKDLDFGLEFNIYSEIARGHWLWFSWVLSSLISSGLFYLSWEIDEKFLESSEINNQKEFSKVYKFAYELEKISKYNNTNWENSFFTFFNTKNPILFSRDLENYKFMDLFDSQNFIFPFDYYIVFLWINSDTQKIEYFLDKDKSKFDNIWTKFKENIFQKLELDNSHFKDFCKKDFNYNTFISTFNILNIKLLNSFEDLFNEPYSDNIINKFIDIINEHRFLMWMVEWKSLFAEKFLRNFYSEAWSNENIWITPIYSWKMWGGYLVVTKAWESRKIIETTLEKLKNSFSNAYIEYCSYEDNNEIEWIKISQNMEKEFYHNSLIWDNYILKSNNKQIIIWNITEALEKDFEIIFDIFKWKVYIKWKKLTTKDIHSQSILTEIISKLFDNQWKWILNKNFNKTSYSESKSLMGSKVVYPLIKIISRELWKDLDFQIKWMWWEFEMKIDFWKLKVWIFDKI